MDCKKIREIYNATCNADSINPHGYYTLYNVEALRTKKNHTCLESMKMLEKYCNKKII